MRVTAYPVDEIRTALAYIEGRCRRAARAARCWRWCDMSVSVTGTHDMAVALACQGQKIGWVQVPASDARLGRIDVVAVGVGRIDVFIGTPSALPQAPKIPTTHVAYAEVLIPALSLMITDRQITAVNNRETEVEQ